MSHEQVAALIHKNVEVFGRSPNSFTTIANNGQNMSVSLLYLAAMIGDVESIAYLLKSGAAVNAPGNAYQALPLTIAVAGGHAEAVEVLVKAGASPTGRDIYGHSPISMAITTRRSDLLEKLLDPSKIVLQPSAYAVYPFLAKRVGCISCVDALKNAGVSDTDPLFDNPLELQQEILSGIIFGDLNTYHEYMAAYEVHAIPSYYPSAKHVEFSAARYGKDALLETFANAGYVLNATDTDGMTSFMMAVSRPGNLKVAQIIQENGANVTASDAFGHTAMNYAADEMVEGYLQGLGVATGSNQTWPHALGTPTYSGLGEYIEKGDRIPAQYYLSLSPKCNVHGYEIGLIRDEASHQTFIVCQAYAEPAEETYRAMVAGYRPGEGYYMPKELRCDDHGTYVGYVIDDTNKQHTVCRHIGGAFPYELFLYTQEQAQEFIARNPDLGLVLSATYPCADSQQLVGHVYTAYKEETDLFLLDLWLCQEEQEPLVHAEL